MSRFEREMGALLRRYARDYQRPPSARFEEDDFQLFDMIADELMRREGVRREASGRRPGGIRWSSAAGPTFITSF